MHEFFLYAYVYYSVTFDSCAPTITVFGSSEVNCVTFEYFTDKDAIMLVDCVDCFVVFGVV